MHKLKLISLLKIEGAQPDYAINFKLKMERSHVHQDLTLIAIAIAIINSIPLIVLGRIGNGNEINHFFWATSLAGIVATLQSSLVSVMIPSLSSQIARAAFDKNGRNFDYLTKQIAFACFILCGFIFCLADAIIEIWIRQDGVNRELLVTLFHFQLVAAAFVSLTIVPYALSVPMRQTRIQLISVAFYLVASCLLLPLARYVGNLVFFGFTVMVLNVCFSVGYFIASTDFISSNKDRRTTIHFILQPIILVSSCVVAAVIIGIQFSHIAKKPDWMISTGFFAFLISILSFRKIFTFLDRFRNSSG